ncbi:hypothetical protein [Burkholderia gladioli]|uniref:hypothetical protein n=1 Tax=Burkholderia gladioli TaxID=28095 RepID=UPI0010FE9231|nr:hypothetical protein [Burkholderia gladioli]MBJ9711325.1 hypothetical protein [Burkholderia gladioli]MDN7499599.1 hypothetical protein [Burkholderia gladioli]MDR8086139.1 hypothetical protein [Burkholderia gladioli]MDZ4041441.1 hypothetical protein [Burkholderia gladioli pv. alliicola]
MNASDRHRLSADARHLLLALVSGSLFAGMVPNAHAGPSDCKPGRQDNTCVAFINHAAIPAPVCPAGQRTTTPAQWMGAFWSQPLCDQPGRFPTQPGGNPPAHNSQPDVTACANNINAYVLHTYGPTGFPIGANLYLADSNGWYLVNNGVRYPYTSLSSNQSYVGGSNTMIEYLQGSTYVVKAISSYWARGGDGNFVGGYEISCSFDANGQMLAAPHTEGYTVFTDSNLYQGNPAATPKSNGTYRVGTGQ